jgi:NAD+ synthase (glutamine-hydrolysing)
MPDLTLAIAQFNPLLGDILGNSHKIITLAQQALVQEKADCIIFPELAITGYPPEDLLLRPECHQRVSAALDAICQAKLPGTLLVGYPCLDDDALYNSVAVIRDGRFVHRYDKQQLPNTSVFDEKRYFTAGQQSPLFELKGHRFGLCICEDLWAEDIADNAVAQGAEAIICINASPFHLQKPQQRLELVQRQQQKCQVPIIYVNTIGGQDELVFDGGSFVLNAAGQITTQLAYYQETLHTFTYPSADTCQAQPLSDEAQIYHALVLGTRDYCNKNKFSHALVGLSGGIDSALTLTVAVDALGPERVEAVMMPSRYSSAASRHDALALCQNLKLTPREISIEPSFQAFLDSLQDCFNGLEVDSTEENIQARCRGTLLMALANKFNYIVLTTGNKSELAVGYSTLYGDMAGGFAVLKDVLKTQVYAVAAYRNQDNPVIPETIFQKAPSAELRDNQTDQDSLPPYPLLDDIITRYVIHNECVETMIAAGIDATTAQQVVRLIQSNEHKRHQTPPGVRVSARAFGRDWRYPITCAAPSATLTSRADPPADN